LFTVGELSADQQGLVKLARDRTQVAGTIEQVKRRTACQHCRRDQQYEKQDCSPDTAAIAEFLIRETELASGQLL